MNQNLYAILRDNIRSGDKTAIATPDGRTWSYASICALAGQYANALVALGLRKGDRVAVQVEKSPEALILYLGVVAAGGVYLPLNVDYTAAEIEYFLSDAEPFALVCRPAQAAEMAALSARVGVPHCLGLGADGNGSLLDLARSAAPDFAPAAAAADDLAAILYTSGTTGRSKGAMLSHRNLLSNALTLRDLWRFTGDDVLLHALPIFHTHGLFVASNVAFLANAGMLFLPKFDAGQVIAGLPRATAMMGVPTFYTRLLDHPGLSRDLVRHVRLFVSGSAPLLAETHRLWEERTGHRILERYGMTETNMNTSNPYDGERVAGTVGLPLPDVALRVVEPASGRPLPADEVGMIEVKGPNVFQGYWRMPEKTREEFRADGFFITGDLGKIDSQGYVHIVGRNKDLIISGGYNIYPKEIELEIDAWPGILESAVFGVGHPDFGEAVVAAVVPQKGESVDAAALLAKLAERLARFKLPKRILVVDHLPRNTMGKVQKNVLRDSYAGLLTGSPAGTIQ